MLVALLLNFVATLVDPTAVHGDFLSPFSRLSFAEKTKAFALLETEAADVAAAIDGDLTEPVQDSISGLIEFLAGALVEFAGFGCFSEFGTFDADDAHADVHAGRLDDCRTTSPWRRTTDPSRAGTNSRGTSAARPQASE